MLVFAIHLLINNLISVDKLVTVGLLYSTTLAVRLNLRSYEMFLKLYYVIFRELRV